jgi:hypothetical protein
MPMGRISIEIVRKIVVLASHQWYGFGTLGPQSFGIRDLSKENWKSLPGKLHGYLTFFYNPIFFWLISSVFFLFWRVTFRVDREEIQVKRFGSLGSLWIIVKFVASFFVSFGRGCLHLVLCQVRWAESRGQGSPSVTSS